MNSTLILPALISLSSPWSNHQIIRIWKENEEVTGVFLLLEIYWADANLVKDCVALYGELNVLVMCNSATNLEGSCEFVFHLS